MSVHLMASLTAVASLVVVGYVLFVSTLLVLSKIGKSDRTAAILNSMVGPSRWLTWLIPVAATAGSLWFSEVAGFVPCELCWYQRIAMYPAAVVTFVGFVRDDRAVVFYTLPLTTVGFMIATWHWFVERVPSLSGASSCSITAPCSVPWFTEFGFVTLAFMSAAGFAGTTAAMLLSRRNVG